MTGFRSLLFCVAFLQMSCRPEGFDAQAWQPPQNPGLLTTLPPNHRLAAAEAIGPHEWDNPEEIALDARGRVYAGTVSGHIQRLKADGHAELFAQLPGQVLGLDFDAGQNLYACVDRHGLWRVDPQGKGELVTDSYEGRKFGLLDDVKVGADGLVYFTEATDKYTMATHLRDVLEGVPRGHLFRYDPIRKTSEQLMDQLGFANGVAVAADASYVLVAETTRYRIRKYQLTGPEAGRNSIFMDNLPGFPDGLSRAPDGHFWVAFVSARSSLLDTVHPKPFLKNILASLPPDLLPREKPYGLIASFNQQGQWLQSLHDPKGKTVPGITSVEERDGRLWLGSLYGHELYAVKAN